MRMRMKLQILAILTVLVGTTLFSVAQRGSPSGNRSGRMGQLAQTNQCDLVSALPYEELSSAEVRAIELMGEEEKLARDVYLFLYEKWDLRIFWKIASSEQQHMNAVGTLIDKYSLQDPAQEETGVFSNDHLQTLYYQLTSQGEASLVDALTVGATIEDMDIFDLLTELESVDNTDVRTVFSNLLAGSENHLRAFSRQLSSNGVEYTAQFISDEELIEILSVSNRGRSKARGQGRKSASRGASDSGFGKGKGQRSGDCPYGN